MKPRSNHSELPEMAVTASATPPPVHDSAVTSFSPLALSSRPTAAARAWVSSSAIALAPEPAGHRQREQGIARGEDVVEHHPEAAFHAHFQLADRGRLHHVEEPKEEEG